MKGKVHSQGRSVCSCHALAPKLTIGLGITSLTTTASRLVGRGGVLSKGRPSPRAQAQFAAPLHCLRSGYRFTVGDKRVGNPAGGSEVLPEQHHRLEDDLEPICRDLSKLQHAPPQRGTMLLLMQLGKTHAALALTHARMAGRRAEQQDRRAASILLGREETNSPDCQSIAPKKKKTNHSIGLALRDSEPVLC